MNGANRSEVKPNQHSTESIDRPDSLVLKLCTKSEIVSHLDKFSSLLFKNGVESVDAKEKLVQDSQKLLQQLTSLPLKSIEHGTESSSRAAQSKEVQEVLLLDLDRELRLRMVIKLLDVQDQTIRGVHTIAEEDKLNSVREIFEINQELSRLSFRAVEIEKNVGASNDHLEQLEASEIAFLKKELVAKIRAADKRKTEKVLDYELKGIREFFDKKANKFSDLYFCGDHAWSIRNFVTEQPNGDGQISKQLAFYLCCENNYEGMCCKVQGELRLLRAVPGSERLSKAFDYVFTRKHATGTNRFIDEHQLFDEQAGWVRNDTIKLQVHLKIKN